MPTTTLETTAVIKRLFPLVHADVDVVAVGQPARVNLETQLHKRGPRLVEVILAAHGITHTPGVPMPLILPDRVTSGLALYALNPEALPRIASQAEQRRVSFTQTVVCRGRPPRPRIAVRRTLPSVADGAESTLHRAQLELLAHRQDHALMRCTGDAASLETLRADLKSVRLRIVGDERPRPVTGTRRRNPARRPLVHLSGVTLPHPSTQRPLRLEVTPPRDFGTYLDAPILVEEFLASALASRLGLLGDAATDCYRLLNPRNEGLPGLTAERYGPVLILETLQGKYQGDEPLLRRVARYYRHHLGIPTAFWRNAPLTRDQAGDAPQVRALVGESAAEVCVREHGVQFYVQPLDRWSCGLFLDQRDNRQRVATHAAGKRLLNLFAHTCAFSVTAAAQGAAATVNVDVSVNHLERGKRNFALNDLPLDDHLFLCSEAFAYFKRARRQGHRFDVAVIDPPSFARIKHPRKTFEIRRDLSRLLAEAIPLLEPGGILLVATNHRQLSSAWLAEQLAVASPVRHYRVIAQPKLPRDFVADPAAQKSLLVRFD